MENDSFLFFCKLASIALFFLGLINHFLVCGTSDANDKLSRLQAQIVLQLWYFSSIPGATVGLWFVLDAKIFRLTRSWSWTICCFSLGVLLSSQHALWPTNAAATILRALPSLLLWRILACACGVELGGKRKAF